MQTAGHVQGQEGQVRYCQETFTSTFFPWAPDFSQSLNAKDFHPRIKTTVISTMTVVYLILYFGAPENGGTLIKMTVL